MSSYDEKYAREHLVASRNFPAQFRFCIRAAGLTESQTVLDLGGGTGAHSLALQDMGMNVTLLDYSGVAIQAAKASGVRRAVQADFYSSPLAGERFDLVLARGFSGLNTEDIAQFSDVMARIGRYIAPGGAAIYWSWTNLSRKWTPVKTFNQHPRNIAHLFDRVLVIPGFRIFSRLPVSAASAADRVARSLPTGTFGRMSIIGIKLA